MYSIYYLLIIIYTLKLFTMKSVLKTIIFLRFQGIHSCVVVFLFFFYFFIKFYRNVYTSQGNTTYIELQLPYSVVKFKH